MHGNPTPQSRRLPCTTYLLVCNGIRSHYPNIRSFWATPARKYFADNLDSYDGLYEAKLYAINRTNAQSLFPRLARKD